MLQMMNKALRTVFLAGLAAWMSASHGQNAGFDVFEYRIEGTTLLPITVVEQAVYPYLGERKTLEDVEQARDALERAYHGAGYLTVLVSIPQQKVDSAVVTLTVTEAPVKRLRVVESRYFSPSDIRTGVPELAEGNVPNFTEMQKQLADLNRSADRRITPVLRAGKTPGTVEVDLKVKDQLPLHGSVELNSRQIPNTTLTRLSANVSWDNLWQRQHSLGVTGLITPENPDQSKVISANYTLPAPSGFLALYAIYSASSVASLGALNVLGNGLIVGGRYILPLPGSERFFHTATFGLDYKNFTQNIHLPDGGSFNTPITYMPFTVGWDGTWTGEGRSTKLGLSANFHVRGLVGTEAEFATKRFKAHSNYAFLRGNFSHTQTLRQDWGATGRASWQIAGQPLINNEQSIIGGVSTVRGYFEVEALGDDSASGQLEVFTPNYAKYLIQGVDEFRLLAFIDGGMVSVLEPLPGQRDRFNLAGTGAGLRFRGWKNVAADFAWAMALEDATRTKAGDKRVHFTFRHAW
jgi:hemolysin activation/secretion protein